MTKSQDTKNWRKGSDLKVGDKVYMVKIVDGRIDYAAGQELLPIATLETINREYRMYDASGEWTHCVRGHQFVKGQF